MFQLRMMGYAAAVTICALMGGLLVGLFSGTIIFDSLSGHNFQSLDPVHVTLATIPALAGFLAGSAVWGLLMGRLAHATDRRRLAIAGAFGFAPITIGLAVLLQIVEPVAWAAFGVVIPLNRLFTLLFVSTAFLIAGVSAWAIGIGVRDKTMAPTLLWRVGLAGIRIFGDRSWDGIGGLGCRRAACGRPVHNADRHAHE